MKILIIKVAATGDVLRTTSILPGLKHKYTNSEIDWVTTKYPAQLLKNNQFINKIFLAEKKEDIQKLKNQEYDLVINLEEDKESSELATVLKKKQLIGPYIKEGKIVYTENSSPWLDMGLISKYGKEKADELKKYNKKTYQDIICSILNIKNSKPILNLSDKELKFAENFSKKWDIKKDNLIIGLNTSAGKRWQLKTLPIEKTIELIKNINKEFNAKILLFGGPEEKERNEKIIEMSKRVIDTGTNNSLLEFAALINICTILITSDSLALNIGIALGKKVIAFFGPTSASEIELYGNGIKIIPKMDCLSCYKKECSLNPNCMVSIGINEFITAIKKLN